MEFILLFMDHAGAPSGTSEGMAEMTRFAEDLARQGKLRRGAPLAAVSDRAHVRVRNGQALVTDGPFAETREVVAGFWVIDVAGRCPHARSGLVEVRLLGTRRVFADSGRGTPFLLAFHMKAGLSDPDGSKMREVLFFDHT